MLLDRQPEALPLNTVTVATHAFLRVRAHEGAATHLAPSTDDVDCGRPRAAARRGLRYRAAKARMASYDRLLLDVQTWADRTMCGLRWLEMTSHEAELTLLERKTGAHDLSGYVCRVCAERAVAWS